MNPINKQLKKAALLGQIEAGFRDEIIDLLDLLPLMRRLINDYLVSEIELELFVVKLSNQEGAY